MGTLDAIEKSGQDMQKVLAWRPSPGRAHIAWQAMHCAATHDKYLNVRLKGGDQSKDEANVSAFGGGSTPSDTNVPTIAAIRSKLQENYRAFREYVASLSKEELARTIAFPGNVQRTIAEAVLLMVWHESHHQGQIHLTWNLYKAAHAIS
jgi:uncharacterized damage-inducible protein DinB